jgi:xylitol oxidase
MPSELEIHPESKTATINAGMNYAVVSEFLHARGWALHNLASLPHISIGGAVATGSHGSGIKNGALHTAIKSVNLMGPDGTIRTLTRGVDSEFYASVVALGLPGIATSFEVDIQPTFEIYQTVYGNMPVKTFGENIVEVLSGAYNVSYFTTWGGEKVGDVWFKSKTPTPDSYFGTPARSEKAHPIFGVDPTASTEQLGVPGPWHLRLPHFRIDANPSAGNELQSEFFVPSERAAEAFAAVEKISQNFGEKLLVTEIRSIAEDQHWMSPANGRETVCIHFTWKNDYEVPYLVSLIEDALLPFGFRAHLGKVFNIDGAHLRTVYPKFDDFRDYVRTCDPSGKFQNEFTTALLEL